MSFFPFIYFYRLVWASTFDVACLIHDLFPKKKSDIESGFIANIKDFMFVNFGRCQLNHQEPGQYFKKN